MCPNLPWYNVYMDATIKPGSKVYLSEIIDDGGQATDGPGLYEPELLEVERVYVQGNGYVLILRFPGDTLYRRLMVQNA